MAYHAPPSPYCIVEVDPPVPVRFIGPGPRQYVQLSNALSKLSKELPRRSDFTNITSSLLWALAEASSRMPDPAAALEAGFVDALDVQQQFLNAVRATTTDIAKTDACWVDPPADIHSKVDRALQAFCAVTAKLVDRLYDGRDPSRVERDDEGQTANDVHDPYDTRRRFRIRKDPALGPRTNDPRIFERWVKAAIALDIDPTIIWMARISRFCGCRYMSMRGVTLANVFVLAEPRDCVWAVSKCSDNQLAIQLVIPEPMLSGLYDYAEQAWPALVPDLRAGRSRVSLGKLLEKPLFTFDGMTPVPYFRWKNDFDLAAKAAGLFYRDPTSRTGESHLVTPQQFRHEYVFVRLAAIEGLPAEERELEREALARHVGWSTGAAMLAYYSHHYEIVKASAMARKVFAQDIENSFQLMLREQELRELSPQPTLSAPARLMRKML